MRKQNTQEDLMRHYKSHYLDNHKELPDDVQALKDIIYVSNVNLTTLINNLDLYVSQADIPDIQREEIKKRIRDIRHELIGKQED